MLARRQGGGGGVKGGRKNEIKKRGREEGRNRGETILNLPRRSSLVEYYLSNASKIFEEVFLSGCKSVARTFHTRSKETPEYS